MNGKRNGKAKEYNFQGNLVFEGEYLNGVKWNGKGYDKFNTVKYEIEDGKGWIKEYDRYGALIFEGKYFNGKTIGIGKKYDYNEYITSPTGLLRIESEYLNGKRNGKGKEFDQYGNLRFEGEFFNDEKAKGREYIEGKLEYEGEYLFNRKYNGKG